MMKPWIFIALIIACNWSNGQSYTNYSEKDGLPSNHVYKITQDVNGFIWIATDEGLVKYNGSEFKIFTTRNGLPTNDIWNMFPARDGKLWYLSKSTSLGYILDDIVYDFKNVKEDVGLDPIYTGFTGDSLIPSGTFLSYHLNSKNQWETVDYNSHKNYVNGSYLIHEKYKGLIIPKLDTDNISVITKDNVIIPLQNRTFKMNSNSRGQLTDTLYVDNSLTSYGYINLNNLHSKRYSYESELNIPFLKYGRMHLANNEIQLSGENVVAVLDHKLKPIKVIHVPQKFKSHFAFIDMENTVWVATFSNGIYKYSLHDEVIKKELTDSKIINIKQVDDRIIGLVNGKGFYEFNKATDSFEELIKTDQFLYDAAFIRETNSSYFLTKRNIISMNGDNSINLEFELVNERARSMTFYKNNIYGHFTSGINKIGSYGLEQLNSFSLGGALCEAVIKDRLIIGASNGLYEINNDSLHVVEELKDFKKPVIDLLTINKDQLLVCTSGYGVYLTDLKNVQLIEGSDFLKANNPYYNNKELFLPTNNGIYYYEFIDGVFKLKKVWNNTNGLPTNKINGVEKIDNKLLVATNQGVIHFPLDYESGQDLIDLYIESAIYNDQDLKLNPNTTYTSNSDLQARIKKIDYRNNQNLTYDYRLLPTQADWVNSNSANLTFTDLTPGKYSLEVRKGPLIKCFEFNVEPMWYQRWWFYALALLGLIATVILITKKLTKASENKKNKNLLQAKKLSELQLKALRSQMNPHFVFNSLNAIQYYINENDFETSDTYLVKFSRLIREFFELSKEQEVSVQREIKLLDNYLALEQLRFKGKLNYVIEVDPELDINSYLPSMLLQPIVENAVNHGIFNKTIQGQVTIKFVKLGKQQIRIHIIDDGVGLKKISENRRYRSSTVLDDRLRYLKESGNWEIEVSRGDASNDKDYPGHEVIFDIKKLNHENV